MTESWGLGKYSVLLVHNCDSLLKRKSTYNIVMLIPWQDATELTRSFELYCLVFELKCVRSLRHVVRFYSDILLIAVFKVTDPCGDCVVIAQNERTCKYLKRPLGLLAA